MNRRTEEPRNRRTVNQGTDRAERTSGGEKSFDLRPRTREFAIRIVRLFKALPRTAEAQVIGKQLLRSGTSIGANYRASQRSRSRAEFVSKMGIVIEEADETLFWLDLLGATEILEPSRLKEISKEAEELLSIFVTSQRTARES